MAQKVALRALCALTLPIKSVHVGPTMCDNSPELRNSVWPLTAGPTTTPSQRQHRPMAGSAGRCRLSCPGPGCHNPVGYGQNWKRGSAAQLENCVRTREILTKTARHELSIRKHSCNTFLRRQFTLLQGPAPFAQLLPEAFKGAETTPSVVYE